MSKKNLLFFTPQYKEVLWGGDKLKTLYGFDSPYEKTGEAWVISAHKKGDCLCVSEPFAGKTLSEIWDKNREVFGYYKKDRFPLLLKIIDAKENLSVQVHPTDDYAFINEEGSLGKTECWYILDCEKDSKLYVGHNAKSRKELAEMIENRDFNGLLREVTVNPGDCVFIAPGTLHSIKAGITLLEIQQNSDITYRVYDFDRLQNGKPRELHLDKAKEAIEIPDDDKLPIVTSTDEGVTKLATCRYFDVEKVNVNGELSLADFKFFGLVSVVKGEGTVDGISVKTGDSFLVPYGYGKMKYKGKLSLVLTQAK